MYGSILPAIVEAKDNLAAGVDQIGNDPLAEITAGPNVVDASLVIGMNHDFISAGMKAIGNVDFIEVVGG